MQMQLHINYSGAGKLANPLCNLLITKYFWGRGV